MLSKLRIRSYEDEQRTKTRGYFDVQINPDKIRRSYKNVYEPTKVIGSADTIQQFKGTGESTLDLEFTLDATGIVGGITSVPDSIRELRNLVSRYVGTIHRPPFLKVVWGPQDVFDGLFVSMDVDYTLFAPSGKPLRAKVSMKLTRSVDTGTLSKEAAQSSPDLTHHRVARAGDTLPLLCEEVYKEDRYYPVVARFNDLDTLWPLEPGARLRLPPLRS